MVWKQSLVLILVVVIVRSEDGIETGCNNGFYFENTQCYPCPVNCTSCLSESFCTSCQDGNYGESCLLLCSFNCNNNKCNKSTGLCLNCAEGFFLEQNQSCVMCPENCKTCASERFCFSCITGYKGSTCTEVCSNCKPKTVCDQDSGYCIEECYDGLSGNNCDHQCPSKCMSCRRDNINSCTTCATDRYGINCDNTCSGTCLLGKCNDNDGLCTLGCNKGYWGDMCEFSCSKYCIKNKCKRTSGKCNYGCAYNYTGSKCMCSQNCNCNENEECESCKTGYGELCEQNCSDRCLNKVCHRETAECLDGCMGGYSGAKCNKNIGGSSCESGFYFNTSHCLPCPQNCNSCASRSSCNSCQNGYYGDVCSNVCAQNCNHDMCNMSTGVCLHCRKGFYFENNICVSCPTNCSDCDSKSHCFECKPGYKGRTCEEVCNNCKHDTGCKQNNGYCITACTDGYCGAFCDIICDYKCRACERFNSKQCRGCTVEKYGTNCTEKCSGKCYLRVCNETDGFCTHGCEKGYWGNKCENVCSRDCQDNFCNRENGTCAYGCFYDQTVIECRCQKNCICDRNGVCQNCKNGFGEFCQSNCSNECADKVCVRETGECMGVKHNVNHETILKNHNTRPRSDSISETSLTALIISLSAAAGVGVVVAVINYRRPVIIKRRRRMK